MRPDGRNSGGEAPEWLRWRAEASPGSLAVKRGRVTWSYAELDREVGRLAGTLRSRGVSRGDRVAVLIPASETYLALIHAVARLGAVVVPLNHWLSPKELVAQVRDADPKVVVYEQAVGSGVNGLVGEARGRWTDVSELVTSSSSIEPVPGDALSLDDPHAIIYTSGSSGAPKGVVLTLSNLMWNSISFSLCAGSSPDDRWLLCLPLFHVGGYAIVFRALLAGSGIVLHQRFEPERIASSLRDDGVTLASFVPTMLDDLLKSGSEGVLAPRLRLVLVGGGKPTPQLKSAVERNRLPVRLTYGMTETCSFVALSTSWSSSVQEYAPCLPSEVRVVQAVGRRLRFAPVGGEGEIAVRGPTLFSAYWRQPALSRSRFLDGWFLTGDLGAIDDSGAIKVIGRKDATIITGGEKVLPDEVESALRSHPSVLDAVVLGMEDKRWGQMVVAVIELRGGAERPSDADLKSFLTEKLGRYKIPKRFVFEARLPRTSTGKPRRAEILASLEKRGL